MYIILPLIITEMFCELALEKESVPKKTHLPKKKKKKKLLSTEISVFSSHTETYIYVKFVFEIHIYLFDRTKSLVCFFADDISFAFFTSFDLGFSTARN